MSADLGLAVVQRGQALTIAEMQSRVVFLHQFLANVLEPEKDYGKIPGTDKPTLFKSGAEKLCVACRFSVSTPVVEDLSTGDVIRYRVNVPIEGSDGRVLAVGVGECSTDEDKYKWRRPASTEEWDATPEYARRLKYQKGGGTQPQVRTCPADLANTVLKMGHKRAFIAATLLATGASSVFNQDLEDFTEELREHVLGDERTPAAEAKKVRRVEKAPAASSIPPDGKLVTAPYPVRDVRVFGKEKNNYAVTLVGDPEEYTTKDAGDALELEKFKGTDHRVRLTFVMREWNGKTYRNISRWELADDIAPPPGASGDIPF